MDWATTLVGEGDTCQLSASFTNHNNGTIYETLAQSTEFDGKLFYLEIAAWLNGNDHVFLEHPGCPDVTDSHSFGPFWVALKVPSNIMHIVAHEVTQAMGHEHLTG